MGDFKTITAIISFAKFLEKSLNDIFGGRIFINSFEITNPSWY